MNRRASGITVTDRMQSDGLKAWVYGTSNHVHATNRNIQAWALDAWQDGANGIVPWQTVDKSGSALKEAEHLFIFDRDAAGEPVIRHSMRHKAYRDAQQLIEYLNLLQKHRRWSKDAKVGNRRAAGRREIAVRQQEEGDGGVCTMQPGLRPA